MLRYNQEQLISDLTRLNNENVELRSKLFRTRVEASDHLINRLRKEYQEQARLQKLLEQRHLEMMNMPDELAKAREEIDSLYKLVNILDN